MGNNHLSQERQTINRFFSECIVFKEYFLDKDLQIQAQSRLLMKEKVIIDLFLLK